jgi:hypothetical protein
MSENYNIDKESGTFVKKDNPNCFIKFKIDDSLTQLEINTFYCIIPDTNGVIPHSKGAGRNMLLDFLLYITNNYYAVKTINLEVGPIPNNQSNLSDEEYEEYMKNYDKHKQTVRNYYKKLGFANYNKELPDRFTGNIDNIISTIRSIKLNGGKRRKTRKTRKTKRNKHSNVSKKKDKKNIYNKIFNI